MKPMMDTGPPQKENNPFQVQVLGHCWMFPPLALSETTQSCGICPGLDSWSCHPGPSAQLRQGLALSISGRLSCKHLPSPGCSWSRVQMLRTKTEKRISVLPFQRFSGASAVTVLMSWSRSSRSFLGFQVSYELCHFVSHVTCPRRKKCFLSHHPSNSSSGSCISLGLGFCFLFF